jgi:hypothetical protein
MHTIRFEKSVAVLVACALLAGCGASAPPKRASAPVEPAATGQPYDFRGEGKIPPASGGVKDEADVEELAVQDDDLAVSEAEAPPIAAPVAAAPADSLLDGFRVQVFASQDRDVAEGARAAATERLGMPAYLDLEGGVYKVRVGDYLARKDADAALGMVRKHDYPDAWVVPSKVRVPRG